MDCFHPITVPRFTNVKVKLKTGNIVTAQRATGRIQVPCGRCPACRRRKQNEWAFRILEEAKYHSKVAFVTLTYDDDHLVFTDSDIPTLHPQHCTTFLKNLRYDLAYKDSNGIPQSFRYFLCGEYGDQFDRPHYHLIFFYSGERDHEFLEALFTSRWEHGFIKYEPGISPGRAKYCAKYSMKSIGFDYLDAIPPFARMSRRPGLGKQFLDNIDVEKFRERDLWHVHDQAGTPYTLPRYYKERIYSKDECDEHSYLLEKIKNSKFDFLYSSDNRDIYNFMSDKMKYAEHLFMKRLISENYGFKFKKYENKTYRFPDNSDIKSNVDFEIGPLFG